MHSSVKLTSKRSGYERMQTFYLTLKKSSNFLVLCRRWCKSFPDGPCAKNALFSLFYMRPFFRHVCVLMQNQSQNNRVRQVCTLQVFARPICNLYSTTMRHLHPVWSWVCLCFNGQPCPVEDARLWYNAQARPFPSLAWPPTPVLAFCVNTHTRISRKH